MILPDVLTRHLNIVFCGTRAGKRSAEVHAYYAGRGNKFWNILAKTGLTSRILTPDEYEQLPESGIGLTDLEKKSAGSDDGFKKTESARQLFRAKILWYAPKILAFNGKRAAQEFYGRRWVSYGRQHNRIPFGNIIDIFVLPSTSGAANGFWDEIYWFQLAEFLREQGTIKHDCSPDSPWLRRSQA